LTTINDQKNKLKQANKEIQDIALFLPKSRSFNTNWYERKSIKTKSNCRAIKNTFNEIEYSTEDFLYIATQIDFDKALDFETQTNGKEYSFVCKTIKDLGYINIYGRDVTEQKKVKQS
jgi:hypothetical protein